MNDRKPKILSISYDPSLLFTRQAMLQLAGYEVVSAEGFADAIDHCSGHFDLIIMGHSIPQKDKRAIVASLHEPRMRRAFAVSFAAWRAQDS